MVTVEEQVEKQAKLGIPVAGIIIEPIQAEGGDNHGSKEFFQVCHMSNVNKQLSFVYYLQGLDRIAHKLDIPVLMDEVQTGGGSTGKMWGHEHFELEHGPGDNLLLIKNVNKQLT